MHYLKKTQLAKSVSRLLLDCEHILSQSVINENIFDIFARQCVIIILTIFNCSSQLYPLWQYVSSFFQNFSTIGTTAVQGLSSSQALQTMTECSDHFDQLIFDLWPRSIFSGPIIPIFHLFASPVWSARLAEINIVTGNMIPHAFEVNSPRFLSDISTPENRHIYEDLFSRAKDVTPQLARDLLIQGVHIDNAKGPEGETVWHAVVKYNKQAVGMLEWLQQNSSVPCDLTSSDGNTPLMLALQLRRVDAAKRLSKFSDLTVVNPSTNFTAPELAARSQSHESVEIFSCIMENIPLDEDWGRKLAKRIPHAIRDGLFANVKKLQLSKLRKDRNYPHLVQQHAYHYENSISIAERYAMQKVHSFNMAMKAPWCPSNAVI